jgi:GNAT superfamily N-acetyltransferase
MSSDVVIRRAAPPEAGALTALAIRSKAHWGYDASFMAAATRELTIAPELIERATCFVAERSAVVGFYVLAVEDDVPMLLDLWVDPAAMRSGIGSALFEHMVGQAQALAYRRVRIESDPNAEPFYRAMGARHVGTVASKVVPGRTLPLMEIEVEPLSDP